MPEVSQYVLFVCANNAGRSQMAEAFLNRRAEDGDLDIYAESAGTLGAGALNSVVARSMEDAGISMETYRPKQITSEMIERASRIVLIGHGVDGERGANKFVASDRWEIPDAAGEPMGTVTMIRDRISAKVDELLDELKVRKRPKRRPLAAAIAE